MVELIPKKEETKLPRWTNVLFYASLAFLIFIIASFFILGTLDTSRQQQLKIITDSIAKENSRQDRKELKTRVLTYKKKIDNFTMLLGVHREGTKFFDALGSITHPAIWYNDIALDMQKLSVKLSGTASSFETLGQQILILAADPRIKDIVLSNPRLARGGGIDFSISFSFTSAIFVEQ